MIQDEIVYQILQDFPFPPTSDQQQALQRFAAFLTDRRAPVAMVLRGSAGTGKSALAGAMVRTMVRLKQKVQLMAPTGRAAKVFALHAGVSAYTIHRRIYRERSFSGPEGSFNLNDNLYADTLFIIDEASMIANVGSGNAAFGSGHLLNDLVRYVYQGRNCRLLLVGDHAQLPPVGESESPALSAEVLRQMQLQVYEATLNEVLRQDSRSGILYNATMIRQMITHDEETQLPKMHIQGFADISVVPGDELIDTLANSYRDVGTDETMVITRSNKRANIYNQGIRRQVLDCEDILSGGDIVMIVKNKYLTPTPATAAKSVPSKGGSAPKLTFIANGDRAVVKRVRNLRQLYGFHFADVTYSLIDYDRQELTLTTVLETLNTEAPALTREQNDRLFEQVIADYADVPLKADRMKHLKEDDYYNALQVKFGYAVTCHKAQGGQWAHVYIDQGFMTEDMLTPDYIHWLYTALTRATEHVYLVNWPKTQIHQSEASQ